MSSKQSTTRELWAYCGVCARWFFVEKSQSPEAHRISCPVCAVPSAIFHNRLDSNKHRVTRSPIRTDDSTPAS